MIDSRDKRQANANARAGRKIVEAAAENRYLK